MLSPLVATIARSANFLRWLHHLGGPGLILLGLLDNSVVPVPGSMDVLVVVLSADERNWWPYYVFMATAGSVIGGYFTYRLARGDGAGRLAHRLKRSQLKKVHAAFEKWGFGAIAIPALLPPPFPMVPFLIAAGAAQYSLDKFLLALFLGRAVRYSILAVLAALYGRQILGYFSQHTPWVLSAAIAVVIAGITWVILRTKLASHPHTSK